MTALANELENTNKESIFFPFGFHLRSCQFSGFGDFHFCSQRARNACDLLQNSDEVSQLQQKLDEMSVELETVNQHEAAATAAGIGNESAPIHLAQCWFLGLAIFGDIYKIKHT